MSSDGAVAAPATIETVRRIALALPGVEEVPSWDGTPSFRVRKTSFVRLREDGDTLVVKVNYYERRFLIEADPDASS
ncbi:MAG TPA: MmcQ/YjbR family DNA-binding protein, partial [Longimicrobium sp.]|nr:MmcQ/YjbR family DNA-binding protein [Longimicrobium sp.]